MPATAEALRMSLGGEADETQEKIDVKKLTLLIVFVLFSFGSVASATTMNEGGQVASIEMKKKKKNKKRKKTVKRKTNKRNKTVKKSNKKKSRKVVKKRKVRRKKKG